MSAQSFFKTYPGVSQSIGIRGIGPVNAVIAGARLCVCSHKKKRFVIAVKYEGETDYRYLAASDLTWRTEDIIKAFAPRWLTEVFIQDRKSYEGRNALTRQRDDEGSERTLSLSLPADHCLFFHPDQKARLKNRLSPFTVGSLIEKSKAECLLSFIRELLLSEDTESRPDKLCLNENIYQFEISLYFMFLAKRRFGEFTNILIKYFFTFFLLYDSICPNLRA